MSVFTASTFSHENPAMEPTLTEHFSARREMPSPLLLHFDASTAESIDQRVVPKVCMRGLRNALMIELAALVAIIGGWWILRLF